MSVAINGTDGITYNDGSLQPSAPVGKNLIINGNMQIAQRATSKTSITADGYYTCDRWESLVRTAGTWTQTQDTGVTNEGFAKSLKMDCTTADASLGASDRIFMYQRIEGFNTQSIKKGTANAESVTLSFWIKSNKTGTYIAELQDLDNSRDISQAYTISSANTWEKKTLTFVPDTTGALDNDNAGSLDVYFWLSAGSDFSSGTLNTSWNSTVNANRAVGQVNLADSTSNYVNITGVQLETGTTATPFENLQYSQQLSMCQRYYEKIVDSLLQTTLGDTYATSTSPVPVINISFKQTKRALPTMAIVGTFTTSNTSGSQVVRGGENTFNAYYLAAGAGRTYFYPDANSGWSADSEL